MSVSDPRGDTEEAVLADKPKLHGMRRLGAQSIGLMLASITPAALQWLMMALVARSEGPHRLGEFAFLQGIAVPAGYMAWMSLRQQVVSKRVDGVEDADFTFLRTVLPAAIYLVLMVGLAVSGRGPEALWLAFGVFALRFAEGYFDLSYGFLQRDSQVRLIVEVSISRLVVSTIVFPLAYWLTHDLGMALLILAGVWGAAALIAERRMANPVTLRQVWDRTPETIKRRMSLALVSAPMALSSVLMSLNSNAPRYALERIGNEALGVFAATFHFVAVGGVAFATVGQLLLPRLASAARAHDRRGFIRQTGIGLALAVGVSIFAIVAVRLVGVQVLRIVYGPEFAGQLGPLTMAAVSAGPFYCVSILASAAFAAGLSSRMAVCYGIGLVATVAAGFFSASLGLYSAYVAITVGSLVQVAAFAIAISLDWRNKSRLKKSSGVLKTI